MNFKKLLQKYYIFSAIFLFLFLFIDNYKYNSNVYDIHNFDFRYTQSNNVNFNTVDGQKININTASKDILLKYLWGIGNSKARNIINYREKMGGFYRIDEILNVNGIGKNIFDNIKDRIYI